MVILGAPAQLDKLYALLNGANPVKPWETIGRMSELKALAVSYTHTIMIA